MTIQILHTADNHLDPVAKWFGSKQYERKKDFLSNFEKIVEYAVENRPDVILISGDLFDKRIPRNPPHSKLVRFFKTLHDKGIQIFLISGHHDTARSRYIGSSPISISEATEFVTFFSGFDRAESKTIKIDNCSICISGFSSNPFLSHDITVDPLASIHLATEGDINIALAHHDIEGFHSTYPGSPMIRLTSVPESINYLAMGHVHRHEWRLRGNTMICYPGSTEKVSFHEEDHEKGFVWMELGTEGPDKPEFVKLETRPMETLDILAPGRGDLTEYLTQEIEKKANLQKILRVQVRGEIPLKVLETYHRSNVQTHADQLCFATKIEDSDLTISEIGSSESVKLNPPLQEFREYLEVLITTETDPEEKEFLIQVREHGIKLLEEAGGW